MSTNQHSILQIRAHAMSARNSVAEGTKTGPAESALGLGGGVAAPRARPTRARARGYETLPRKKVVYVLPITSILGRLPVVRAGDKRTIPLAPIATNKTLQKLTPAQGLGTALPCTLSIPGLWAGPAICEIEMT